MVEVSLIRHGETEYNLIKKIQGSLDSPLTKLGESQCRSLGSYLSNQPNYQRVDEWISSPQGRAMASSKLIRQEMKGRIAEIQMDDRIHEIFCGDLEGRLMPDVDPKILNGLYDDPDFAYPNGESINDVVERARQFWSDLKPRLDEKETESQKTGEDYRVVIVSHGNFIRCLSSVIMNLPSDYAVRVVLENTGLCYFRSSFAGPQIKMLHWNARPHLI